MSMATTKKTEPHATQAADEPAARTDERAPAKKTAAAEEVTLPDRSADFATAARAFVEDTKQCLADLVDKAEAIVRECAPQPDERPLIAGVERVTSWAGDIRRALDGLHAGVTELDRHTAG